MRPIWTSQVECIRTMFFSYHVLECGCIQISPSYLSIFRPEVLASARPQKSESGGLWTNASAVTTYLCGVLLLLLSGRGPRMVVSARFIGECKDFLHVDEITTDAIFQSHIHIHQPRSRGDK